MLQLLKGSLVEVVLHMGEEFSLLPADVFFKRFADLADGVGVGLDLPAKLAGLAGKTAERGMLRKQSLPVGFTEVIEEQPFLVGEVLGDLLVPPIEKVRQRITPTRRVRRLRETLGVDEPVVMIPAEWRERFVTFDGGVFEVGHVR